MDKVFTGCFILKFEQIMYAQSDSWQALSTLCCLMWLLMAAMKKHLLDASEMRGNDSGEITINRQPRTQLEHIAAVSGGI